MYMRDENIADQVYQAKYSLDACTFESLINHKSLLALSFDSLIGKSCFNLVNWDVLEAIQHDEVCLAPYFWHTSELYNGRAFQTIDRLNVQGFEFKINDNTILRKAQKIAKRQARVYQKAQFYFSEFQRLKKVEQRPHFVYSFQ